MQEIISIQSQYPTSILFVEVGSFYEIFDQLPTPTNSYLQPVANLLDLRIASRKRSNGTKEFFAGFPSSQIDVFLQKMVDAGYSVVVVDQVSMNAFPNRLLKRAVTRVVTPGTALIDTAARGNSFLVSLVLEEDVREDSEDGMRRKSKRRKNAPEEAPTRKKKGGGVLDDDVEVLSEEQTTIGMAWADVGTGEFYLSQCTLANLRNELTRIHPKEILVNSYQLGSGTGRAQQSSNEVTPLMREIAKYVDSVGGSASSGGVIGARAGAAGGVEQSADEDNVVGRGLLTLKPPCMFTLEATRQKFKELFAGDRMAASNTNETAIAHEGTPSYTTGQIRAAGGLINYLIETYPCFQPTFRHPVNASTGDIMIMNGNVLDHLEITHTMVAPEPINGKRGAELGMGDGNLFGTLMGVVDFTATSAGFRLLANRLRVPSISITEINRRLDLATCLKSDVVLLHDLRKLLHLCKDVERVMQKMKVGMGLLDKLKADSAAAHTGEGTGAVMAIRGAATMTMTGVPSLLKPKQIGPRHVYNIVTTLKAILEIKARLLRWIEQRRGTLVPQPEQRKRKRKKSETGSATPPPPPKKRRSKKLTPAPAPAPTASELNSLALLETLIHRLEPPSSNFPLLIQSGDLFRPVFAKKTARTVTPISLPFLSSEDYE
ncbi:hypothetical protein HK102_008825, partial [Quaeritorhiza haematococci]